MVEQQVHETYLGFIMATIKPDFNEEQFIKNELPKSLKILSDFLGNNDYICGPKISYADFETYEALNAIWAFSPEAVSGFPNLSNYIRRFEDIPSIKKYQTSGEYQDWPIYGPAAKTFGFYKK